MANLFDNWRTAWASLLDEQDEAYPHHVVQPDQAAFMDKHLGNGQVIMYFDELATPDPQGTVHDELHTYKPALDEEDVIRVYDNGVYVDYSVSSMAGSSQALYRKA